MKTDAGPGFVKGYVADLAASGRYTFTSHEAREVLGGSADAVKLGLHRLSRQGAIASPARGFYVIVPPEYRSLGCLPAEQFVPDLMARQKAPYYAGLLSAAQYHGAAHQRPQVFQVMVAKARRAIRCGRVRVAFIVRKRLGEIPVQPFNTPRGSVAVSTAEATAVDLVGYHRYAGGLSAVATILQELAESLDPAKLVEAARTAPIPWAQRMGYLLARVGASTQAASLRSHVQDRARDYVPLLPSAPRSKADRDREWKLLVNAEVETDL